MSSSSWKVGSKTDRETSSSLSSSWSSMLGSMTWLGRKSELSKKSSESDPGSCWFCSCSICSSRGPEDSALCHCSSWSSLSLRILSFISFEVTMACSLTWAIEAVARLTAFLPWEINSWALRRRKYSLNYFELNSSIKKYISFGKFLISFNEHDK